MNPVVFGILNRGLNGQTVHFDRLLKWLEHCGVKTICCPDPLSAGWMPFLRFVKKSLSKGFRVQIHLPSANFILPFWVIFCHPLLEFYVQGRLIHLSRVPWKRVFLYPSFFILRLLLNNSMLAFLLIKFGCKARILVSSKQQVDELNAIGYPSHLVTQFATCPPLELFPEPVLKNETEIPVLGYLGHGTPVKGLDVLAKALTLFPISKMRWKLLVALGNEGEFQGGQIAGWLKSTFPGKVQLLGKTDAYGFFKNIEFLVLPYVADFGTMYYPTTLIDALAAGVIPIVSGFPGFLEPVEPPLERFSVTPDCPHSIAQKLTWWLRKSPEEILSIRKNLQLNFRKRWGKPWKKAVEEHFFVNKNDKREN